MDVGAFTATIIMLVVVALLFDFMNGFHDAANSIATVVSTGVLKPYQAVIWAASFNFVAILLFHLKVAATVGKGIVDPAFVDMSEMPGLTAALVLAYIEAELGRIRALGYDVTSCLVDDGATAEAVLAKQLDSRAFDCVLIGAALVTTAESRRPT